MNIRRKIAYVVAVAALAVSVNPGLAEDIDIYASDTGTVTHPNVLVVIDNSANWSSAAQHWPDGLKQGQSELESLRTVANELGGDINVGLMLFTAGQNAVNPNGPGGYVRYAIRPMDAANKAGLAELIGNPAGCVDGSNSINGTADCIYQNFSGGEQVGTAKTDYSATMYEVYNYFHPGSRYAGLDPNTDSGAFDPAYASYTNYLSPINVDSNNNACARNYLIFIGNGFPTQDSPASLLQSVGGDPTQLAMPDFTTASNAPQTDLLETAACGTYSSVTECEAAAAAKYGNAYDSYSCTEATTCSSGSTVSNTTVFGISACGQYPDQATCESALNTAYGTSYSYYTCAPLNSSCAYTMALSPPATVDANLTCLAAVNQTDCTSVEAPSTWPNYAAFSCTNSQKVTSTGKSCGANSKSWLVTAAEQNATGSTFTMSGTKTYQTTTTTTSYNIYGTRTTTTVTPTGTASVPTGSDIRYADEWAKFLHHNDINAAGGDQNITTYTIDVFKDHQDVNETRLLLSMARAGGGKYFTANNADQIKNALRQILSEIQSVNSVFASSSLPVSVNTQGTYLNQVFIGMFRPEATGGPRWAGNLKQYKFNFFQNQMRLADKYGAEAISSTTGFITPCATSIWSTDTGSYWNYPESVAAGLCNTSPGIAYSDAPDGDVVEKGGAAQKLRGVVNSTVQSTQNYVGRNLLTCAPGSCGALTAFNDANTAITTTALGVTTATDPAAARTNLINWVRGQDLLDENGNGSTTEVRPYAHGGVIHSQPAVIDYGSSYGVVAYYGGDDGIFHAVKGGTTDSDGTELWGFIAPETWGNLLRLENNSPLINFPTVSSSITPTPKPKDYFFDGSTGVYQNGGTVWVYPTMRRGGRAIYAFDVSNPGSPSFKWRNGCFTSDTANDTTCTGGWSDIGQTWSKPEVVYLTGSNTPVLLFGGGYDTCEDANTGTPACSSPKGANIWFVNADTGAVIRKYNTNRSVPGEIAYLTDDSGKLTYAYAADTGGHVYRIKVGSATDFSTWSDNTSVASIEIANLSDAGAPRKFLFGPDVVQYADFNAVLVGSGDREHPLLSDYPCAGGVQNRFFMIQDDVTGFPSPAYTSSSLMDITGMTSVNLTDITSKGFHGWYYNFAACEQAVNRPLTFAGVVNFGTNEPKPAANSCSANLGEARGYALDFLTGMGTSTKFLGGGLPPSPVAGIVDVDGKKVPFLIGGGGVQSGTDGTGCDSALCGQEIKIVPPTTRERAYWFKDTD